jgi:hypothetical protein
MQVCRTDADARLVRRKIVHRFWALLIVAAGLAGTSAQAQVPTQTISTHVVKITVPDGWRRAGPLSYCSDPRQVLAISRRSDGAVILVLETRVGSFAARSTFRLSPRPTRFEGCCGQPTGPGYQFTFRERGRDFYAYVFSKDRAAAHVAVAILNTLRVVGGLAS